MICDDVMHVVRQIFMCYNRVSAIVQLCFVGQKVFILLGD